MWSVNIFHNILQTHFKKGGGGVITHKSAQRIVWFFQEGKNNDIYSELFND